VLDGLLDSHTGSLLLLEASQVEGERSSLFGTDRSSERDICQKIGSASSLLISKEREGCGEKKTDLLLDLSENGSRVLHLELVGDVRLLVDGGPGLARRSLSVGRGSNENVDTVNLSLLKGLDLLLRSVLTEKENKGQDHESTGLLWI
jgi:hypothetical protein